MIDGKEAHRYARRRLGFVTYWCCRVEDTVRNWLVKRDFVRLGIDGVWCVMMPADACDTLKDSDDAKQYTVEPVRMTMRQFNRLHDFGGY